MGKKRSRHLAFFAAAILASFLTIFLRASNVQLTQPSTYPKKDDLSTSCSKKLPIAVYRAEFQRKKLEKLLHYCSITDIKIQGWLSAMNLLAINTIDEVQQNHELMGSIGEIGVHLGKVSAPTTGA